MEIKRTQKEEQTSLISVKGGEKDYGEAVEKSLRDYRRKANIPGVRPGMVPMGSIKKMYGKGVVAEQSYRTASNAGSGPPATAIAARRDPERRLRRRMQDAARPAGSAGIPRSAKRASERQSCTSSRSPCMTWIDIAV